MQVEPFVINLLTSVFGVVFILLGYVGVFGHVETDSRRWAFRRHQLGTFSKEWPVATYACAFLVALRILSGLWLNQSPANNAFWLLINLQIIIVMYSNLMLSSIWSFALIQLVAAGAFISVNTMSVVIWVVYMVAGAIIFTERLYGHFFDEHPVLYGVPPLVIGLSIWTMVYLLYPQALAEVVVQLIAFLVGGGMLILYNRSMHRDQQAVARLRQEVQYDALTGARNWQTFGDDFARAYTRMSPDRPLALISFDIDKFKSINDQYGHLAGNQVLMSVVSAVQQVLRDCDYEDWLYRTGGEEFAMVLQNTDEATAKHVCSQCQTAIRGVVSIDEGNRIVQTASFGVTMALPSDRNATNVFRRADHQLYRSKEEGRDRMTVG